MRSVMRVLAQFGTHRYTNLDLVVEKWGQLADTEAPASIPLQDEQRGDL